MQINAEMVYNVHDMKKINIQSGTPRERLLAMAKSLLNTSNDPDPTMIESFGFDPEKLMYVYDRRSGLTRADWDAFVAVTVRCHGCGMWCEPNGIDTNGDCVDCR
jgi:hypothetical protein